MSAALELRALIYTALSTNEAITENLVSPAAIGDETFTNRVPCIRIGPFVEAANNLTYARRHSNIDVTITAFIGLYPASVYANMLADHIRDALRFEPQELGAGFRLVDWRWETTRANPDAGDATIWQATLAFTAMVERAA